jgi:hypothetical protein
MTEHLWTRNLLREIPLLESVALTVNEHPVALTEFDAASALVVYRHALDRPEAPLVLLVPAGDAALRWSALTLAAWVALDDVTAVRPPRTLPAPGTVVCIDGRNYARFLGTQQSDGTEFLRVSFDDMTLLLPSTWAARMRPAPAYAGSMARYRDARRTSDPFRRAFSLGQDGSIEALRSCILLVATRSRTEELFAGVRVSGVDPLSTNLVSFASRDGCIVGSGLPGIVVVVPSLSAVRSFLGAGSTAAAVLVDGMRHLLAGRDHVPFLQALPSPPALVTWAQSFEYPPRVAARLPPHKIVAWTRADLQAVNPLQDARSTEFLFQHIVRAPGETRSLDAVARCLEEVRSLVKATPYFAFQLSYLLRAARRLLAATPATGRNLTGAVLPILESVARALADTREGFQRGTLRLALELSKARHEIGALPSGSLSKAEALLRVAEADPAIPLTVVCDLPQQVPLVQDLLASRPNARVISFPCADASLGGTWVVPGWSSVEHALRLDQSGVSGLTVIADSREEQRWLKFMREERLLSGARGVIPILAALAGGAHLGSTQPPTVSEAPAPRPVRVDPAEADSSHLVPCAVVWLTGEFEARTLERDTRVLVVSAERLVDCYPLDLKEGDNVVLPRTFGGADAERLLTEELISALDAQHPDLLRTCQEWRRCLREHARRGDFEPSALRRQLAALGVSREEETVRAWLDTENRSVLAPKDAEESLERIWQLVGRLSSMRLEAVQSACGEVRRLHARSRHAAWATCKGQLLELPVEESWLGRWALRVRRNLLDVRTVIDVEPGEIPRAMLGWPLPSELAQRFVLDSATE